MSPSSDSGEPANAAAGIDAAADETQLREGFERAVQTIRTAGRGGTQAAELAAGWSAVLRAVTASAVRLVAVDAPWSWLVSGSVARGEAVPGSDVETLIVAADDADTAALQAAAADVHALLERCGVRVDANGVLASRTRFCRTQPAWVEAIGRWAADPRDDRGVVMTGVLADASVVFGPLPEDTLRARVVAAVRANYPVRQHMLHDATTLRAAVPSRLKILATQSDTVDLKAAAVDPVVKIARWAALSAGSTATSTMVRLDAASNILDAEDISSLRECFIWLLKFRWDPSREGDVIALSTLAPQQRAMLRSVAREVAGIGRKLTFLASTSAFR